MSAPDTGYHAPIVLADERERRARRQRPYPAVNDFTPPTPAQVEAADERAEIARSGRATVPTAVVAGLLLIALTVVLVLLKG